MPQGTSGLMHQRKRRTLWVRLFRLTLCADVLGFGVGIAGFAFAALFQLLGEFFALLGAGFGALLSLLVELLLGAEQLDVGHLRGVALAGSEAGDAKVAAVACAVTRCHGSEEAIDRLRRHEVG